MINEKALIRALTRKQIYGAGLDVFENEPIKLQNKLMKLDNCILSSHNAFNTNEEVEKVHNNTVQNLIAGLKVKMKKKFDFVIVIPARLKSSRFPGKPLAKICEKPMIYHVWKRCIDAVNKKLVFVATDNMKIINVCKKFGIQSIMTSAKCKTGN